MHRVHCTNCHLLYAILFLMVLLMACVPSRYSTPPEPYNDNDHKEQQGALLETVPEVNQVVPDCCHCEEHAEDMHGYSQEACVEQEQVLVSPPQEVWLTVFIHGIMNIKPHLSVKNAFRFVTDTVHDTLYARTVEIMRDNPFFYQNQVMHRTGLVYIDPQGTIADQNSLRCMTRLFNEIEQIATPHTRTLNRYYAFGWDGLLSQKSRNDAAFNLFCDLTDEIERLKVAGMKPYVRVIGYSHGGNVALNVARVYQENSATAPDFCIDELVLLGTPIKTENNCLVHSACIKKVYNFYSLRDCVQRLDLFSHNQLFSRRMFINHTSLMHTDKIVQIQLKVMRMSRNCYTDACSFEQSKQTCYNSVVTGASHLLRDISPGHTELWFFGWTPRNYRKQYPLHPLPTVALVPYLLPYLRALPAEKTLVTVDIRPEHEFMLIKSTKKRLEYTLLPFISTKDLERLKQTALEYAPTNHTDEAYQEHIKEAFKEACHACALEPMTYQEYTLT